MKNGSVVQTDSNVKKDFRSIIQGIKYMFLHEEITYEEAKDLVAPLLKEMNEIGSEVAKKHDKRYTPLTFGYVFR